MEEPLADEEWLQNHRKEQEDKEGLARELKSTLMSVPVSESPGAPNESVPHIICSPEESCWLANYRCFDELTGKFCY